MLAPKTNEVATGYRPILLEGGFGTRNGDVFWRPEEDGVSFGTRIEDRHCNPMGTCHGGWLATYLDIVLPLTGRFTVPDFEEHFMLTVNLSIDYLAPVNSGDWLIGRASVLHRTDRMAFIQGMLTVDERPVLRGNGTFRVGPQAPRAR